MIGEVEVVHSGCEIPNENENANKNRPQYEKLKNLTTTTVIEMTVLECEKQRSSETLLLCYIGKRGKSK